MIQSFKCKETEKIWQVKFSRRFPNEIQKRALRKPRLLFAADKLEDLRILPSNRLELLRGNRQGQHSIRINRQWIICFVWKDGNALDIEIEDYHSL